MTFTDTTTNPTGAKLEYAWDLDADDSFDDGDTPTITKTFPRRPAPRRAARAPDRHHDPDRLGRPHDHGRRSAAAHRDRDRHADRRRRPRRPRPRADHQRPRGSTSRRRRTLAQQCGPARPRPALPRPTRHGSASRRPSTPASPATPRARSSATSGTSTATASTSTTPAPTPSSPRRSSTSSRANLRAARDRRRRRDRRHRDGADQARARVPGLRAVRARLRRARPCLRKYEIKNGTQYRSKLPVNVNGITIDPPSQQARADQHPRRRPAAPLRDHLRQGRRQLPVQGPADRASRRARCAGRSRTTRSRTPARSTAASSTACEITGAPKNIDLPSRGVARIEGLPQAARRSSAAPTSEKPIVLTAGSPKPEIAARGGARRRRRVRVHRPERLDRPDRARPA